MASVTFHGSEYLNQRAFMLTMLAAFALHVTALGVYHLLPKQKIIDVPVRTLNIKLGSPDAPEDAAPADSAPPSGAISHVVRDDSAATETRAKALADAMAKMLEAENKPAPVNQSASSELDRLMGVERVKTKPKETPKPAGKPIDKGPLDVRKEGSSVAAPTMPITSASLEAPTRFVRPSVPLGNELGNREDGKVVTKLSYDKIAALWIEKFKTTFTLPNGVTGVPEAKVTIYFDRSGNISSYEITKSSGFPSLDQEAIKTIKAANPIPAAPNDFFPNHESLKMEIPFYFNDRSKT